MLEDDGYDKLLTGFMAAIFASTLCFAVYIIYIFFMGVLLLS